MLSLAQCPHCQRAIQVASLEDHALMLRCPLCNEAFAAGEVVATATPAPPLARPLTDGDASDAALLSAAAAAPGHWSSGDFAPSTHAGLSHPLGEQEYGLAYDGLSGGGQGLPDGGRADAGGNFAGTGMADLSGSSTTANAGRRQRSQGSAFGALIHLLMIVGGGVLGIGIGYVILLVIGHYTGRDTDVFKLKPVIDKWIDTKQGAQVELLPETDSVALAAPDTRATTDADATIAAEPATGIEAATILASPPLLGPVLGQLATAEELQLAAGRLEAALGCPLCEAAATSRPQMTMVGLGQPIDSTTTTTATCELCQGHSARGTALDVQEQLSRLAMLTTRVRHDGDAQQMEQAVRALQMAALRAAGDGRRQQIIGRLASEQLAAGPASSNPASSDRVSSDTASAYANSPDADSTETNSPPGIALTGTVQHSQPLGSLHRTTIILLGTARKVDVLSRNPLPHDMGPGSRLLVLGTLHRNPSTELAGYTGIEQPVVWGGLPIKLPATEPRMP